LVAGAALYLMAELEKPRNSVSIVGGHTLNLKSHKKTVPEGTVFNWSPIKQL